MKLNLILAILFYCTVFGNGQAADKIDIAEQYQLGVEALQNYQYQIAVDHFYECHRVDTKNSEYLRKLSFCYLKLGDYSEAKLSYNFLLKQDSTDVNAWSNLGSIYEKELNYRKASECYQELLGIDSTNSFYFRQSARIALRLKNPLAAIAFFDRAHELNERDLIVITELSSLLLKFQQPENADEMIEKGLKIAPDNLKILYTKAGISHHQKKYEQVVSTLNHAMSLGDTTQYYQKMIGAAHLYLEQFDSCIYHLRQVVDRGESTESTHYQLALAYRGIEDFEQSELEYAAAIEKGLSPHLGVYYKNLALLLDERKKYKAAIPAWKKAVEYAPKESEYLFYLAKDCDAYYKDKKIAKRYYRKYLDTKHPQYREYVRERIQYLNGILHQQKNSVP